MDFEDALQRTQRLTRAGPLRLRYETSLLICEPVPQKTDLRRTGVRLGGFVLMAFAFITLITHPKGAAPWPAVMLAVLGAALLLAGDRLFKAYARRRFILNFATESLRIDDLAPRVRTRMMHFDEVSAVEIAPDGERSFALVLTARTQPVREVLVGKVGGEDVEELRALWRLLHDAFGLRRPGVEL